MPLTINVGLSRKASQDFQSSGVSINVTAELDQTLLARPDELQGRINELYEQAEVAVERQLRLQAAQQPPELADGSVSVNDGGRAPARTTGSAPNDVHANAGRSNGQPAAPMTQSQERAIQAIAKRAEVDASTECRKVFGWDLAKLTLRQASEYIDHLKVLQPSGSGGR